MERYILANCTSWKMNHQLVHSLASGFGRIDGQVHAWGCLYETPSLVMPWLSRSIASVAQSTHITQQSHSRWTFGIRRRKFKWKWNRSQGSQASLILAGIFSPHIDTVNGWKNILFCTHYVLYSHCRAQCNLTTLLRLAVKKIICLSLGVPREVISAGEEKYIVNHFASLRQNTIFTTASH